MRSSSQLSRPASQGGAMRVLAIVVIVVTGLLAIVAWRLTRLPEADLPLAAEAPAFRLASLDGQTMGPDDFKGQVVLVDFWATWCTPCHLQAKILDGLYDEYRAQGVEFLAISTGEEEVIVRRFVDDHPYRYPVLLDPEDSLSRELGIYALPTLMIIDGEGKVTYFRPGVADQKALRRILDETLAGQRAT